MLISQVFRADTPLTVRAGLPAGFWRFVTTDMDVGGWEQAQHFVQHVLQEGEGGFLPGAVNIGEDAEAGGHLERAACAGEFGVGCQCGGAVTGNLDLWHNGDVTFGCVSYDFTDIILCVKAAMRQAVVLFLAEGGDRSRAVRTDFRQSRVFLDLDTPALVFGQMPVEHVQFLKGHQVEQQPDGLLAVEVAAFIKHEAAPGKARFVFHKRTGDVSVLCDYLAQRLDAVEDTRPCGRFHCH